MGAVRMMDLNSRTLMDILVSDASWIVPHALANNAVIV